PVAVGGALAIGREREAAQGRAGEIDAHAPARLIDQRVDLHAQREIAAALALRLVPGLDALEDFHAGDLRGAGAARTFAYARRMSNPAQPMPRLLALLIAAACARGEPAPRAPRIALSPCRLKGTGLQAKCGTLRVPEDRKKPEGRHLDLRVAVI